MKKTITTYEMDDFYGNGFIVDVIINEETDEFEVWACQTGNGIKHFVFGGYNADMAEVLDDQCPTYRDYIECYMSENDVFGTIIEDDNALALIHNYQVFRPDAYLKIIGGTIK